MKTIAAAVILFTCAFTPNRAPADEAQQLQKLRERIDGLQRNLNDTRGRRDAAREELQQQERGIGERMRALRNIEAQLARDQDKQEKLKREAAAERRRLHAQMRGLEAHVRAAYVAGRQEYLKLLLNQEDPAASARVMTYYRYVSDARVARITGIRQSLMRIEQLEAAIDAQTRALTVTRAEQLRETAELDQARARRAVVLMQLDQQVTDQTRNIARLRADEQRLERLLDEIQNYASVPFPGKTEKFAALRGRLPFPVPGRVLARFGQQRHVGDLTWRGIFLSGNEGRNVQAVFRGRVVYADWLRGFGLLLILDHGDAYMTLYGHNQALYRQVGDWVEAGQAIAAVGNTGDAPATGVYFEIRHNGKPYDPMLWCSTLRASGARARQ